MNFVVPVFVYCGDWQGIPHHNTAESQMETEEFRAIKGFPGYEVSNFGKVRSWLGRPAPFRKNQPGTTSRILQWCDGVRGYPVVNLYRNRKVRTIYVHKLVIEAFGDEQPPNTEIRHLDGNNRNPAIRNLAWGTHKENEADKVLHGTRLIGERHPRAKLSLSQVHELRVLREQGWMYLDLARRFGISKTCAFAVAKGRTWKSIAEVDRATGEKIAREIG